MSDAKKKKFLVIVTSVEVKRNIEEYQKIQKSINKYLIMTEENISQEFRLKNIDET